MTNNIADGHSSNSYLTNPRGRYMTMGHGRRFFPLDPRPEEIFLEDIALSLSKQCRYNGNIPEPYHYSVAEHCCILSDYFKQRHQRFSNVYTNHELAQWAFVHDFEEAYTGDMIRPIKHLFPEFIKIGDKIQGVIFQKFTCLQPGPNGLVIPQEVHDADATIYHDERIQLWPIAIAQAEGLFEKPRLHVQIKAWERGVAYKEFMFRALELGFV
jgi:uncharacterized protein